MSPPDSPSLAYGASQEERWTALTNKEMRNSTLGVEAEYDEDRIAGSPHHERDARSGDSKSFETRQLKSDKRR